MLFTHFLHLFVTFWHPFVTFCCSKGARDYPRRILERQKTAEMTLFSAVFCFPGLLAGRVESEKRAEKHDLLMLFCDY